jgi:hypothetical protein
MFCTHYIAFINRFTGDALTNVCYPIDEAFGIKQLTFRGYIRDYINNTNGRSPGFVDAPMLFMVHRKDSLQFLVFMLLQYPISLTPSLLYSLQTTSLIVQHGTRMWLDSLPQQQTNTVSLPVIVAKSPS